MAGFWEEAWQGWEEEAETAILLQAKPETGTVSFPAYSIGVSRHRQSQIEAGGEIDTTSLWQSGVHVQVGKMLIVAIFRDKLLFILEMMSLYWYLQFHPNSTMISIVSPFFSVVQSNHMLKIVSGLLYIYHEKQTQCQEIKICLCYFCRLGVYNWNLHTPLPFSYCLFLMISALLLFS